LDSHRDGKRLKISSAAPFGAKHHVAVDDPTPILEFRLDGELVVAVLAENADLTIALRVVARRSADKFRRKIERHERPPLRA
jgi:hypothetical protein